MTNVIKSTDETVTGLGYEFAASGDALIVLQGVTLQSASSYVVRGASDRNDVSATVFGTLATIAATAITMEGTKSRVVIGETGLVSSTWSNGGWEAVSLYGDDSTFTNFGTVVSAAGSGLYMSGNNLSGYNAGMISGGNWGITLNGSYGSFRNDGTILRTGGSGGDAAAAISGTTEFWFENTGVINTLGNGAVVGLKTGAVTNYITNSGEISSTSYVGLLATGATVLKNTGTISGGFLAVGLSTFADTVINSGLFRGNVFLEQGADLYDGRGGTVLGFVHGGTGDDTFRIDNTRTRLVEVVDQGIDRVEAWISFALDDNIENLTLMGMAQKGTGNARPNSLLGNAEDNLLAAAAGNDVLSGGLGDDRLYGGADADSLLGGDGRDLMFGQLGNDSLNGEGENDSLSGGAGADSLLGGDDDDRLLGGADNDTLFGDEGADVLSGGRGNDQLTGGTESDVLNGNQGNDTLSGGDDEDRLLGGVGRDELYGGADADVFVYTAVGQTAATVPLADQIRDFQRGLDVLDLSGIDANSSASGNQAFAWLGTAAFTGVAGQLRYGVSGTSIVISGTVNADAVADFAVVVTNTAVFGLGDLLL